MSDLTEFDLRTERLAMIEAMVQEDMISREEAHAWVLSMAWEAKDDRVVESDPFERLDSIIFWATVLLSYGFFGLLAYHLVRWAL